MLFNGVPPMLRIAPFRSSKETESVRRLPYLSMGTLRPIPRGNNTVGWETIPSVETRESVSESVADAPLTEKNLP